MTASRMLANRGRCPGASGSRSRGVLTRLVVMMLLLVPLQSCSTRAPLPDIVENIRENVLDAYGGRARLAQIQSLAAEGSITAIVRGDSGVYRRAWRRDGKLFVDIRYTKSRETRILNGNRALRSVDGKLEDVSGPSAAAMAYQYNEVSMPFALLDNSLDIQSRGMDLVDGSEVQVLRCTDRAGNIIDLFVNENTHRIVKTTGTFSIEGKPATLSAEYSNFRFVEGILLPFRIVNSSGTTRISEIAIDDYLVNASLNDSLFDPHTHSLQK